MRGSVYRRCFCRDPETGRTLGMRSARSSARRRVMARGFSATTHRAARAASAGSPRRARSRLRRRPRRSRPPRWRGSAAAGRRQDRSLRTGAYLAAYAEGKIDVKPRTQAAIREAVTLYWEPALGHLRLVDVRDHHIAEAIREMGKINRPLPDGERPSEMLRRMLAARAASPRKGLAPGDARKKSIKPLSPARIKRVFAVLHAALAAAVPGKITVNPCDGVILPRVHRVRPLPWTAGREAAFRSALERRIAEVSETLARELTAAERQRLWAHRRSAVAGDGVDARAYRARSSTSSSSGERLYALFCLVAYCGLRRDEVIGLAWADLDLDQGVAYIRETGSGDGPKSDSGTRAVPLAGPCRRRAAGLAQAAGG